jgi:large subunit ribosomal protein L10
MATKAAPDSVQIKRKADVIDEIRERLRASDAAVLTEYRGLTVTQIAALRAALRPAATDYKIFKNTLARRAAENAGLADLVTHLEGPVAIAFVRQNGGDAVTAAKALRDFARANPNLVLKGGILGDRVLTNRDVEALADVPPRDELLARLAGGFQAPLTKAAGLFQAFTRNFAYGLKAYADQRAAHEESRPDTDASAPADTATGGESDHEVEESRPDTDASAPADAATGGEQAESPDATSEDATPEAPTQNEEPGES